MRVKVRDLIGEMVVMWEEGERIHELIAPVLERGERVVLDFDGVKAFNSGFFAGAIGRLIERDVEDRLPALLRYENLPYKGQLCVDQVVAHWTRRREIPGWGAAWDAAVKRRSEEDWE
jgi:hypothetical protein